MKPTRLLVYAALAAGAALMLFPLWWMFVVSMASPDEASTSATTTSGVRVWPSAFRWENYPAALERMGANPEVPPPPPGWWPALAHRIATFPQRYQGFLDAFSNTVVITTLCVVGQVLSCSLVGYGFARLRFRGREGLFVLMIATMMLPAQVTMIPMFLLFRTFGWIDTLLPLVVPAFFGAPFFIFMFRQFFAQIPEALVEAARIDGCGHVGVWWRIMLPICRPVIAITGVFTFVTVWNDFLGPLIYLQSEQQMTLAVALNQFKNQYGDFRDAHLLMAASIVTMLPCIVLFFLAQRQFVGGLSLGAVKG